MTLYSRATVQYQRISRSEAAFALAERLRKAGYDVTVEHGEHEVVNLYGNITRDVRLLSYEEAAALSADPKSDPVLQVKRLTATAKLPTRGSPLSAGLDIYYDGLKPITFYTNDRYTLSTGIAIKTPEGTYARVAPRSGLGGHGLDVLGGVVDGDYRGEVRVILAQTSYTNEGVTIKPGDKIAQIILERCVLATPVDVEELDSTERGANGFGSTGA